MGASIAKQRESVEAKILELQRSITHEQSKANKGRVPDKHTLLLLKTCLNAYLKEKQYLNDVFRRKPP
jgi:hypothetical protein